MAGVSFYEQRHVEIDRHHWSQDKDLLRQCRKEWNRDAGKWGQCWHLELAVICTTIASASRWCWCSREPGKGHLDGTMKTLPFSSQFTAEGYLHKCTRLRHTPPRHLFGCISSSSFLHCTALPHPAQPLLLPSRMSISSSRIFVSWTFSGGGGYGGVLKYIYMSLQAPLQFFRSCAKWGSLRIFNLPSIMQTHV